MKKLLCFAVLLAVLGLTATGVLSNATVYHNNYEIPYAMTVWVPCALDGAGEYIYVTGRLHVLEHVTLDDNGGYHYKAHFQPKDLKGVGLTSGDKYEGTGVTQETTSWPGKWWPWTYTYVNNFRMIGQGPGNNYTVHETWHFTFNANGELTAYIDNYKWDCK